MHHVAQKIIVRDIRGCLNSIENGLNAFGARTGKVIQFKIQIGARPRIFSAGRRFTASPRREKVIVLK